MEKNNIVINELTKLFEKNYSNFNNLIIPQQFYLDSLDVFIKNLELESKLSYVISTANKKVSLTVNDCGQEIYFPILSDDEAINFDSFVSLMLIHVVNILNLPSIKKLYLNNDEKKIVSLSEELMNPLKKVIYDYNRNGYKSSDPDISSFHLDLISSRKYLNTSNLSNQSINNFFDILDVDMNTRHKILSQDEKMEYFENYLSFNHNKLNNRFLTLEALNILIKCLNIYKHSFFIELLLKSYMTILMCKLSKEYKNGSCASYNMFQDIFNKIEDIPEHVDVKNLEYLLPETFKTLDDMEKNSSILESSKLGVCKNRDCKIIVKEYISEI